MLPILSSITENIVLLLISSLLLTIAYVLSKREKYLAIGCALSSAACVLSLFFTISLFIAIPNGPATTLLNLVAFANWIIGLGALLVVLATAKENIAPPMKGSVSNAPWLWKNITPILMTVALGAIVTYLFGSLGLGGGVPSDPNSEIASSDAQSGIASVRLVSLLFMTAFISFYLQATQLVRIWMKGNQERTEEP